jgi:hypothetical protein
MQAGKRPQTIATKVLLPRCVGPYRASPSARARHARPGEAIVCDQGTCGLWQDVSGGRMGRPIWRLTKTEIALCEQTL